MAEPRDLAVDTCWRLIAGEEVGRVGFDVGRGPRIHPMNYLVHRGTVLLRTSHDSEFALFIELFSSGAPIAFEVDHLNKELRQGWSVLMSGPVVPVTGDDERLRLGAEFADRPWADGNRDYLVRLTPVEVTGRRLGM